MSDRSILRAFGVRIIAVLLLILLLFICFRSIENHEPIADERFHLDQIFQFSQGHFAIQPTVTQIPGYHAIVAAEFFLLQRGDMHEVFLDTIRLCSFILSLATIVAFFACALSICGKDAWRRILLFVFFPILFPLFFLLYTDVAALGIFLLGLFFVLRQRSTLGLLVGSLSILVRQTSIVWVFFLALSVIMNDLHESPLPMKRIPGWGFVEISCNREGLKRIWSRHRSVILMTTGIAVAFFLFMLVNGGIAVQDKHSHPVGVYMGNIWLTLFLFFLLFLPLHVANAQAMGKVLLRHPLASALCAGAIALLVVVTFNNFHPNNHVSFFLRNRIVTAFSASIAMKLLFSLPIMLAVLSLAVTRLRSKPAYLLYPMTVLCLLPSWLIEERYALIPFVLFLLFIERQKPWVEYSLLAFWILLSAVFFWGIRADMFFL
ncbi:hypothetical protein HY213_01985 [Candidatus Peregrinibacteria bacterium]|nr:hypothetical protein [Candidatus Peregrinibacteria bacterium]